jgi:hypothetical protein
MLYQFGLSYPPAFRVRGDAYEYLVIASNLDSFSAVLSYAGDRTVGFPFFEFMIRKVLEAFAPSKNPVREWVNAICAVLLITHFVTAWIFSAWVRRTNLVKSENTSLLLFFFLATYPALIGHTTTPLTDTLAIDLILCALASIETALKEENLYKTVLFTGIAGSLFGLSILVRPGSIVGVTAALFVGGLIALFAKRRKGVVIGATIIGCMAILAPTCFNCTQKYGRVCLQSTQVGVFIASAQVGLRGARTLWNKGGLVPGHVAPILPDDIMVSNYFSRCHLKSIFGVDESSLIGCVATRPLAAPAFVIKKWIGLFDHFRFTPYVEQHTPFWLRWLSRTYDSLAWIGLALFFLALSQAPKLAARPDAKEILARNITPVMLIIYSISMLALHTILHVEDRYGFPVIPLCTVMLFIYGERAVEKYRSFGIRSVILLVLYCILAWTLFVTQIIVWDNTDFY